jgi:Tol biopolymer transport system component
MDRWPWVAGALLGSLGIVFALTPLKAAGSDGPRPELIGEGVISTPDDELGGTITADGQTLYFEKSAPPHYLYVLYESRLLGGRWTTPSVLPFSGVYKDTDPVLSPDGETLFFASDRPVGGVDRHHFYIWAAKRAKSGWSEPVLLEGPVNDGFNQVFCSIASSGNLYFASSRKTGHYDIFRSRLLNGRYQPAEDMGPAFNGPLIDSFEALVSPDETFLLIGSFGREDSYGSSDLYISYNEGGHWTAPKNLGPVINTAARDYSPRISGDGKWLLYTSERFDRPLSFPLSYRDFVRMSRSVFNGLGNLYRIPLDYVLRTTRPGPNPSQ